jgi:hypothetical protein
VPVPFSVKFMSRFSFVPTAFPTPCMWCHLFFSL